MTTVVLGAGVIGVTTAYYLARDGHRVIVVDRQRAAGLETSFANGGLVTPSMADPWAAPGVPTMVLKGLGREDAPFVLRLSAIPGLLSWGLSFLRNCAPSRWRANTEAIMKLAVLSRDALDELSGATSIRYDRFVNGTMRVYRDAESFDQARHGTDIYRALGIDAVVADADGTVALEPALRPIRSAIAGAVHFPGDRAGDAMTFTQELARLSAASGVEFRFGTNIRGFEAEGDKIAAVATDQGRVAGDSFVLALGSHSPLLARHIGLTLPIYPVKGYSATFSSDAWNDAPSMPVVDYKRKTAVTRLGQRIRLAGTVEFNGYDQAPNPRRGATLLRAFGELFPERAAPADITYWSGLRPMTPNGRPLLGPARFRNLWLNTGHGPLGWTLACGSAMVTTALVGGKPPPVDIGDFALARF